MKSNGLLPVSLKQNTSNFCLTAALQVTRPVLFCPQLTRALIRGITARFSSVHPNLKHKNQLYIQTPLSRGRWAVFYYLHVSNPLCRASLTSAFEAIVTPRVTHILRASEALKAYWSWSRPLKRLTWNTPAMVWFSAGKTGKNIELWFKEVFAFRKRIIVYLWCHFWQNSDHTWHRWLTALTWCKAKTSSWLERWRDGETEDFMSPSAEGGGLNRGDSVRWGVWILSLPECKGKGRGKSSSQGRLWAIIVCPGPREKEIAQMSTLSKIQKSLLFVS